MSALALAGLTRDLVVAALPTEWAGDPARPWLTRPTRARTPEKLLAAAISTLSSCPTLMLLGEREGAERPLVIGRPCQMTAVRMRSGLEGLASAPVLVVVDLFCTWAVSYRGRLPLAAEHHRAAPRQVNVPQERFVVEADARRFELDHGRVRAPARPAYASCEDIAAELADLSVGSTEWRDDWSTLGVRSQAGEKHVAEAERAGLLGLEPSPPEQETLLRQAARGRKLRVRQLRDEEA